MFYIAAEEDDILPPDVPISSIKAEFVCIDDWLENCYLSYCADFGPLNIAKIVQFTRKVSNIFKVC